MKTIHQLAQLEIKINENTNYLSLFFIFLCLNNVNVNWYNRFYTKQKKNNNNKLHVYKITQLILETMSFLGKFSVDSHHFFSIAIDQIKTRRKRKNKTHVYSHTQNHIQFSSLNGLHFYYPLFFEY